MRYRRPDAEKSTTRKAANRGLKLPVSRNRVIGRLRGGCDRDRTCDPYHVKEAHWPEIADFIGTNGTKNGGESRYVLLMFMFSGSLNLGALPKKQKSVADLIQSA